MTTTDWRRLKQRGLNRNKLKVHETKKKIADYMLQLNIFKSVL